MESVKMIKNQPNIISKRGKRQSENFSHSKLYDSLICALRSANSHPGEAHDAAKKVCELVADWLQERPEVTSQDIRRIATKHLSFYHTDAAYLYAQNKNTI